MMRDSSMWDIAAGLFTGLFAGLFDVGSCNRIGKGVWSIVIYFMYDIPIAVM